MPHSILVVEDHEPFRRYIRGLLAGRAGAQTFEASDGHAAVEKAEALQPDVILLDIQLPGLNGFEVARRLPRISPLSKILFLSHESDSDIIHETLRLGATGYVHKLRCEGDLMPALDAVLEDRYFVSSLLGGRHPGRHEVLFCSDASVLIEGFSRFVGASLDAGHAAIVLATGPHRDGVARTLRETGTEIDAAIERGRCILLDAAETLEGIMVDGAPDPHRFREGLQSLIDTVSKATGLERPRVALCGECVGLLCANGHLDAALSIEQTGNDLVKAHHVDILCAYPEPRWRDDDPTFGRVCAEHSAVRYV